VPLSQLQEDIVPTLSHRELLEALESLQQRSLIERHLNSFSQQPVVMEYMAERLISQHYEEYYEKFAIQGNAGFESQPLKAQTNHVREAPTCLELKSMGNVIDLFFNP
jgi:predicted glycosyl hydrolase (DUF1957 family)